uniref:F-box and regulator of chromosome condensation repeat protein n=1 Tax=Marseillevirus LCMAC201 TaxID=2506605 RepID=A0A481YXK7_9VIRU|nr:MAG: F-box and regulator of chromosome condensation repeat protein [Marseillevirus LCMAC201]
MDVQKLLICKQDLQRFSNRNLQVLAKHRDVTASNKCDLCWLLSIDIISKNKHAAMDPAEARLLSLPPEMIFEIGLKIPVVDIWRICAAHPQLNTILCDNNSYWHTRYIQDFGKRDIKVTDWKKEYISIGDMRACGKNNDGQLGMGDTFNRLILTKIPNIRTKSVACGNDHTIVIDLNNNIWCCGDNDYGQLGLGDTNNRNVLIQIPNFKAKAVACGYYYTVVIDLDNNVWCCGENDRGQLGLGDTKEHTILTPISNFKAKAVACGNAHTVVIDLEDHLWGCGVAEELQLGLPEDDYDDQLILVKIPNTFINGKTKSVSCATSFTVVIDQENNIWVTGSNEEGLGFGILKDIEKLTQIPNFKAKSVSCGNHYTIVIDLEDNIWGWGTNNEGQLGLGDNNVRTVLTQIPGMKAKSVACGEFHTIVIDLEDNIWGCGNNSYGQLGLNKRRGGPVLIQIPNTKAKSVACGSEHTISLS